MITYLKDNFKIWWLGSFYVFLSSGFFTTLYVYFVKRHISFQQILFVEVLTALTVTITVLVKRRWHTQYSLYFGFICTALAVASLFLSSNAEKVYVSTNFARIAFPLVGKAFSRESFSTVLF